MTDSYRIVSVEDCYLDTGKVLVKIQSTSKAEISTLPVKELYHDEWLKKFSREDIAHIAALYSAHETKNLALIKQFPKRTPATKESIIAVGILFVAFLILSNLTAFKLVGYGSFTFPAGLIFFPMTYVFDDILTEVYGFKVSRLVIWSALLANTIIFMGTWLTVYLTPSPYWHQQNAYAIIYQGTPRVFIASAISYFIGEFTNAILIAKLKIAMQGRHLWMRIIASTATGVGIDTVIFSHIAFLFTIPYVSIWKMILVVYLFKVIYEIAAIPLTYKIANYLKKKDNIDHYDFNTRFNPFSLAV